MSHNYEVKNIPALEGKKAEGWDRLYDRADATEDDLLSIAEDGYDCGLKIYREQVAQEYAAAKSYTRQALAAIEDIERIEQGDEAATMEGEAFYQWGSVAGLLYAAEASVKEARRYRDKIESLAILFADEHQQN